MFSTVPSSSELARILEQRRKELALALVDSVSDWNKYSNQLTSPSAREEFAMRETAAFVDYLARYFVTGDLTYRNLYLGEKLNQCYAKDQSTSAALERRFKVTRSDRASILRILSDQLSPADRELLLRELDAMHELITRPAGTVCRVLFIGDCLFLDLTAFLTVPLLEAGIQVVPFFVTSKLPGALRKELVEYRDQQFDLVFYSPFTYEFHPGLSKLQTLRGALRYPSTLKSLVAAAWTDVESILQLIESLFECPVFIHNSASLRRHDGTLAELCKNLFTQPARKYARRLINASFPKLIDRLNQASHRHLFLIDETLPFAYESERALSRYIYKTSVQHPARFAQAIAPVYQSIIPAQLCLANKKVIVCDLDNTLWNGVIGDGPVQHYQNRQEILRRLRHKGFLLAICSKNDPKNVNWRGAALSEADFVCGRINWAPKATNIRNIATQLNLKTKDFIFIDDRADERELVRQAMPEITVLDADAQSTWSQLEILAITAQESSEGDRTQAYFDRENRQQFLMEAAPGSELTAKLGSALDVAYEASEQEALAKLELRLSIRNAKQKELKRVAELINRTNQFNLCGSRTTLREATEWHQSERHGILVAEASDKFGSMGIVSVAVVEESVRGVEIPVFVLSCRVFGYGMETALLNCMRRWRPGRTLYGHFRETPHNQPCHNVYRQNGFVWDGKYWVSVHEYVMWNPAWLSIENNTLAAAQSASG